MTLTQQLAQFIASGIVNATIYALLGLALAAIHTVTRAVNVGLGWGAHASGLRRFTAGPPVRVLSAVVARRSLWVVGVPAVALVVRSLFVTRTLLGKSLRACAVAPARGRLMGERVERMSTLAW